MDIQTLVHRIRVAADGENPSLVNFHELRPLALMAAQLLEDMDWHFFPEDPPKYTGSYIICTASYHVCTAKWYERHKRFAGSVAKYVIAWKDPPDPPAK